MAILFLFMTCCAFAEVPKKVYTQKVSHTALADEYLYPGKIVSTLDGMLKSETVGIVSKIYVTLGQRVKKGEALLKIQRTDPSFQYKAYTLRAPFNAVISNLETQAGQVVNENQLLVRLVEPRSLEVRFAITVSDYKFFQIGQTGQFESKWNDIKAPIEIIAKSPAIDPVRGTLAMVAKFKSKIFGLPGSLGTVKFEGNSRKSILLPEDAITLRGKSKSVKIVDKKGLIQKRNVVTGKRIRGKVEITKGLMIQDEVVTRSSAFLKAGDLVEIANEKKDS